MKVKVIHYAAKMRWPNELCRLAKACQNYAYEYRRYWAAENSEILKIWRWN